METNLKRPFCCAINIETTHLEHPFEANKKNKYSCPDCDRKIKFCRGDVNIPYFSHYASENPCTTYNKKIPDTVKHSNAVGLLYDRLLKKDNLLFYSECKRCDNRIDHKIEYTENCNPVKEYQFLFNEKKRIGDVVLLSNTSEIEIVFEIYNTHKTNPESRPEPWYEIKADNMLTLNTVDGFYEYKCIRNSVCKECIKAQDDEIERLKNADELKIKKWKCSEEKKQNKRIEQDREINKKALEIFKTNLLLKKKYI